MVPKVMFSPQTYASRVIESSSHLSTYMQTCVLRRISHKCSRLPLLTSIKSLGFSSSTYLTMASTPDRGTKINMDLVPTIQSTIDQRVHLLDPSTPTNNAPPSSAKRKAPLETYRTVKHPKEITSTNHPLTAKSVLHDQTLILAGKVAVSRTDVVRESPWVRYRRVYELNFDGPVSVVSERVTPYNLFIVKHLEGRTASKRVRMLQAVRHRSFHYMLECFSFGDSYFAVFEHDPISLAHIAKSPPYLTELELAAVLGQVSLLYPSLWSWLIEGDP